MSLVWKFYNIAEIKIQKIVLKFNKQFWHMILITKMRKPRPIMKYLSYKIKIENICLNEDISLEPSTVAIQIWFGGLNIFHKWSF